MARLIAPPGFGLWTDRSRARQQPNGGGGFRTPAALLAAVLGFVPLWTVGAAQPEAAAAPLPGFSWAECPVEVPPEDAARVRCGVLTVPEDRAVGSRSQRTIDLPVAVIASRSPTPAADPLVFPSLGGPGSGSFNALGYFLHYAAWAIDEREVVLVEQRGDELSKPTLDCPELDGRHFIVAGRLAVDPEARELEQRGRQACRERLAREGVDLATYATAESAADLADLRDALGYDQWNLYGLSYGSRLAQVVMRDRPQGLRSVILDGVLPPSGNRHDEVPTGFLGSVRALLAACSADERCRTAYPDLAGSLTFVLQQAGRTPLTMTVKHPVDRSAVTMSISDTGITTGFFDALYDAGLVRALPFVLDQLARGNTDVVLPLAQQNLDGIGSTTDGLYDVVECAEEIPFTDEALRDAARRADPLLEHLAPNHRAADCAVWQVPARPLENQPVTSDIPTLLTSGAHDPVTPPGFAPRVAAGLSRNHSYTFPTMAHGSVWQSWVDPCPAVIAKQFLHDPTTRPDSSCIAAMPPPAFLTIDDILPSSAFYRLNSDLLQDRDPVQLGLAAAPLLIFLGMLGYGTVTLLRRRHRAPRWGIPVGLLAAVLNLAFVAAIANVLLTTDPVILGFGAPTAARPLFALPLVAAAASLVLAAILVRAWLRHDGSLRHRWTLSVVAIAGITFAAWLLTRGLLLL